MTARNKSENMEGDDAYYMKKMKEILESSLTGGLPTLPKHPRKLLDYVFIGNQDNADDHYLLPALGITHVLNCAGTRHFDLTRSPYPPELGIVGYRLLPAEDYEEFDMMQFFPEAITFLDRVKDAGGKALVHCNLGVNRSGAIAAVYLMATQKKTLLEVIADLKLKRSLVLCNVGFRKQVLKYARARGLLDPVREPKIIIEKVEECKEKNGKIRVGSIRNGYKTYKLERSESEPVHGKSDKNGFKTSEHRKQGNGNQNSSPISIRKEYGSSGKSWRYCSKSFDDDLICGGDYKHTASSINHSINGECHKTASNNRQRQFRQRYIGVSVDD